MPPKVSVLWLNYNSSRFIDLAMDSLKSVKEVDYPNLELIVVDNASTDGSIYSLQKFAESIHLKHKLVISDCNLGFTGGNNLAYRHVSEDSRYIMLLNNDAVLLPDSLASLVEYAEQCKDLGAVQGIITNITGTYIDTAGDMLDELGRAYLLLFGCPVSGLPSRDIDITFMDGACCLVKKDALRLIGLTNHIFDEEIPMYFDDMVLGLRLWNKGFKVKSIPKIVARHKRGTSSNRYTKLLYSFLGRFTLLELTNSRYKLLSRMYAYKIIIRQILGEPLYSKCLILALIWAQRISKKILKKQEGYIDIYKAPILIIRKQELLRYILAPGRVTKIRLKEKIEKAILGEGAGDVCRSKE